MIAVSLDGKVVNVCVCIPISTLTLSALSNFFRARKSPPPSPKSEGARTPVNGASRDGQFGGVGGPK